MAEFLLELFGEEIPARMQAKAAADLKHGLAARLDAAGLDHGPVTAHATPRRIVAWCDGLPARQPDTREERKGPKVGAPRPAIDGFLKAAGVSLEQCEQRETPKGPVWFAVIDKPGRPTPAVLADAVHAILHGFSWPKSMRWAESPFRWVRPLHRVLAIFDGRPITDRIELAPGVTVPVGPSTAGHRFLAPAPVSVDSVAGYRAALADAKVMLDSDARQAAVLDQAHALCAAKGLRLKPDPALAAEVAGLVEWPVVRLGRIEDRFMAVPPEVLTTSMKVHQRYFSIETPDGALAPYFVVVLNTEPRDGGATAVAGNERVLRARLSDARFFWDQDRAKPLDARLDALEAITFHAKLGSLRAKVARMEALAVALCAHIPGADEAAVRQAARLAKADLTTGMVGEFPELQGIMGRYYAEQCGAAPAVAQAVAQHYRPLGPSDACPSDPVAVAVALADKLDTLVGFFGIGEKPTGSRDPFALRRAALGIIRLITENGLRLGLSQAVAQAIAGYQGAVLHSDGFAPEAQVIDELRGFFGDRLKVVLKDRGVRHDLIDAVFALEGEDDLVRILARVEALAALLATEDGGNLLAGYRRAGNILRIEAKKDGVDGFGAVEAGLLAEAAEQGLHGDLQRVTAAVDPLVAGEAFSAAMAELARLRPAIDRFFDDVVVNAADPALRRNRLAMLAAITGAMDAIADFGRVEG